MGGAVIHDSLKLGGVRLTRQREHAHGICLRRGRIEEFFGEPLRPMRDQIEEHFGFQIVLARTEVGGCCPPCQGLSAEELAAAAQGA